MLALRNHARAPANSPHKSDLRDRATSLLRNLYNISIPKQRGRRICVFTWGAVDRVQVCERGVSRNANTVGAVPVEEFDLLEVRVQLELVDCRFDDCVFEEVCEL